MTHSPDWRRLRTHVAGIDHVAASSGLDDSVFAILEERDRGSFESLPLLAGRAVSGGLHRDALVLLGWPNMLGRLESGHHDQSAWLWDPGLAEEPPGPAIRSPSSAGELGDADGQRAARVRLAVSLAKSLDQLRGVRQPWTPETPLVTVLLPIDARLVEMDPPLVPLPERVVGMPGAATIMLQPGATDSTVAAYAASLARSLEQLR